MSSMKTARTAKKSAKPRAPKTSSPSAPAPKPSRKAASKPTSKTSRRPTSKTPRKRASAAKDGRTAVVINVGFGTPEEGGAFVERQGDEFIRYDFGAPVLVTPETAARLAQVGTSELPSGQHGQPGWRPGFATWPTIAAYEAQRRQAENQYDAQRLAKAKTEAEKLLKDAMRPKPAKRQPGALPPIAGGR